MNRYLTFAGNILAEILNYIIIVSLQVLIFFDFLKRWPGSIRVACLVLIPVCYYLARSLCNHAGLFFLIHLLPVLGVIMLYGRETSEKVVFGGTAILLALISISKKLSRKPAGAEVILPPAAAGIFFAVYLADGLQGKGACGDYLMQLMSLYMLLYFLYFYFMQFLKYMEVNNRTTEHIPINRAFHLSFGLLAGYIGILAIVIFLLADRQLADRIASAIGRMFKAVIAFLFSFYRGGEAKADTVLFGAVTGEEAFSLPTEAAEPSFLAQILDVLLALVALIAAISLLIAVVIGFIRLIKGAFSVRKQKTSGKESEEGDRIESLILPERKEKKRRKESGFAPLRTPAQAVRRQYIRTLTHKYRVIREEKSRRLMQSGTARECSACFFKDKQAEAFEFAALYEKARYSKEECDREDVRQMKRLSAQLLK